MGGTYCGGVRFPERCPLAECLVTGACAFADYDNKTNEAFAEAADKTLFSRRRRILDEDGRVQLCEQCNGDDGRAVQIHDHGLQVRGIWTHDAFGSGVCRMVYMCDVCYQSMLTGQAWFDEEIYQLSFDPESGLFVGDCSSCAAHINRGMREESKG